MLKQMAFVIIILVILSGCGATPNSSDYTLRLALIPTGTDEAVYYFKWSESSRKLEVSFGTRRSKKIVNSNYMSSKNSKSQDKILTQIENAALSEKVQEVYQNIDPVIRKNLNEILGGRYVNLLINDKQYDFFEGDINEDERFGELLKILGEYSPITVDNFQYN